MDAAEMAEWVSYFQLENPEYCEKLRQQIELEKPDHERTDVLRSLLDSLSVKK